MTDGATPTRWVGVGISALSDAGQAGTAATRAAIRGEDAKLVVVFASRSYDLAALLLAIGQQTGNDVPVIGCTTAGEIGSGGLSRSSVSVTVLGGSGFTVETSSSPLSVGGRGAGRAIAEAGRTSIPAGDNQVFLMLIDGLSPNHEEVLRAAYTVLGENVPLVGGAAGDDAKMERTQQFHNGEVLTEAVVGALISSDAPFGIGARHGWQPVGDPMTITKSVGGRLFSLDGKPALDAYLDRLVAPAEAYHDAAAFRAFAAIRPLSIKRHTGGEVRGVDAQPDFANRSLGCTGELPQGGQAWAMRGDATSVLAATGEACEEAMRALNGRPAIAMMAFDCLGRFLALGDDGVNEELSIIATSAGDAALSGLYTYGEIARTRGMHGYHHMTLVMLAIA